MHGGLDGSNIRYKVMSDSTFETSFKGEIEAGWVQRTYWLFNTNRLHVRSQELLDRFLLNVLYIVLNNQTMIMWKTEDKSWLSGSGCMFHEAQMDDDHRYCLTIINCNQPMKLPNLFPELKAG